MAILARSRAAVGLAVAIAAVLLGPLVLTPSAVATAPLTVTHYPVPGTFPWGTAFDARGRVWVALPGCDLAPSCPPTTPPGKLALFDPVTHTFVKVVSLPSGYGQPLFVAVSGEGRVWFTMPVTNAIGVYDPWSGNVAQWAVPTLSAGPWDLALDWSGKVWFTEHYVNQIASFDPWTRKFHEIATPTAGSNPYGITLDRQGNVWFTENPDAVAQIGEYTRWGGHVLEYRIRNGATVGSGLTPHLITIDGRGNPWWSEGFATGVGTLDREKSQPGTNDGVTEYLYSTPFTGHTSGIAYHGGRVWLDDSNKNVFGWLPVYGGPFTFLPAPGNHPHDGLNVDWRGRVWFDEEFSNTLAEATPAPEPDAWPGAGDGPSAGAPGAAPALVPAAVAPSTTSTSVTTSTTSSTSSTSTSTTTTVVEAPTTSTTAAPHA
jgi:streptogramin lyase